MKTDLVEIFQPFLKNEVFQEVLHLVEQNSQGKIWIIGGYVYKKSSFCFVCHNSL